MPELSTNARLKALREELNYVNTQIRVDANSLRRAFQKKKRLLERISVLEERLAEKSKKSERSGKI